MLEHSHDHDHAPARPVWRPDFRLTRLPQTMLLGFIRLYQVAVSPLLPPSCIYYPTCSHYGFEAVSKYGVLKGGLLTIRRLLRCTPFHQGGYDPVP